MNASKFMASALLFTAAGATFAGDLLPFTEAERFVSSKTRAELRAEAVRAVHLGDVAHGDMLPSDQLASTTKQQPTRAEVPKDATSSAINQHAPVERMIGS